MSISAVDGINLSNLDVSPEKGISIKQKPKLDLSALASALKRCNYADYVIQDMISQPDKLAYAIARIPEFACNLLYWDVDLEARNSSGHTPLLLALQTDNRYTSTIINRLLDEGADIKATNSIYGDSFLHYAARAGNLNLLALAILRGVNPLQENVKRENTIHAAAISNNNGPEIIKFLHRKGVNINQKNINEETPLYVAAAQGSINNVRALLSLGADINQGRSSLEIAALRNHHEIVKLLIEQGAG